MFGLSQIDDLDGDTVHDPHLLPDFMYHTEMNSNSKSHKNFSPQRNVYKNLSSKQVLILQAMESVHKLFNWASGSHNSKQMYIEVQLGFGPIRLVHEVVSGPMLIVESH